MMNRVTGWVFVVVGLVGGGCAMPSGEPPAADMEPQGLEESEAFNGELGPELRGTDAVESLSDPIEEAIYGACHNRASCGHHEDGDACYSSLMRRFAHTYTEGLCGQALEDYMNCFGSSSCEELAGEACQVESARAEVACAWGNATGFGSAVRAYCAYEIEAGRLASTVNQCAYREIAEGVETGCVEESYEYFACVSGNHPGPNDRCGEARLAREACLGRDSVE